MPTGLCERLYATSDDLWGVFVAGAPAFLCTNLNPSIGLANGSRLRLHSLVLDQDVQASFEDACDHAAPGETVSLDQAPKAVMATVHDKQCGAGDWIGPHAMANADGTRLIPVTPAKAKKAKGPVIGKGRRRQRPLKVHETNFELGFAITFHKVQGQTTDRIILALEKPARGMGLLTAHSLYVGLTRVRANEHMRILPLTPGCNLRHLLELEIESGLRKFLDNYDENGKHRWLSRLDQ